MVLGLEPGLAVSQATHLVDSALLGTIHVSHSHEPVGFLNLSPNELLEEIYLKNQKNI